MEKTRPTFQNWLKEQCKDKEFKKLFEEEKANLDTVYKSQKQVNFISSK